MTAVWDPGQFRDLIAGRRRGPWAASLRLLLRAAEAPYGIAVRLRNHGYDRGVCRVHHLEIPVVSVGNLTLGGTGKTPMVAWLARWLGACGVRPAIVSRGYGAPDGHPNDEARELALRLPGVPHFQNPDRVAAARLAIETHRCTLILLDDGFQHRRLGRDLDIVLVDSLEPFGFGHLFPRGTLREPLSGLARAGVVGLSRADMASTAALTNIRAAVFRHAPAATWCELVHVPHTLISASGASTPLSTLVGRRLAAFCGIGNPAGFRHTLNQCGYQVVAFRPLADHYAYTPADLEALTRWATAAGAQAVVCTQKDLVKIEADRLGSLPLWAVRIELEPVAGQIALEAELARLLARYGLPGPD